LSQLHRWRMMRIDVAVIPRLIRLCLCLPRIHQVTQLLARLEERHPLGRNRNRGSGLRISSGPRVALSCAEAPKAADLHLIVGFQGTNNGFEQRIDNDLTVTASEIAECGNLVD